MHCRYLRYLWGSSTVRTQAGDVGQSNLLLRLDNEVTEHMVLGQHGSAPCLLTHAGVRLHSLCVLCYCDTFVRERHADQYWLAEVHHDVRTDDIMWQQESKQTSLTLMAEINKPFLCLTKCSTKEHRVSTPDSSSEALPVCQWPLDQVPEDRQVSPGEF